MEKTMTKTKARKPTFEEDKARAEELMTAYAGLQADLDKHKIDEDVEVSPIKAKYKKLTEPITESLKAAEAELIEIGERNKKKFVKDKFVLKDGWLLNSKKTIVKMLDGFSWPKFLRKFPEFAEADFNVKELKKAFTDGDQRPQIMEYNIDLKNEETIKVKINKQGTASDEGN